MSARTAEVRPARHSRAPRTARGSSAATALLAVAALAGATLGSAAGSVVGAAPAVAAWRAQSLYVDPGLETAKLGARFDPRGASGTGSNPYSAAGLLLAGGAGADLVNTSSVPARVVATVSSGSLLSTTTVTLTSCTLPWAASTCPGVAKDVATVQTGSLGATPTATWAVDLDTGGVQYLRFSAGGVAPSITLSATVTPQRTTGQDRTAS